LCSEFGLRAQSSGSHLIFVATSGGSVWALSAPKMA
jgi:hypothetical protein